jgi:hypothetical protein
MKLSRFKLGYVICILLILFMGTSCDETNISEQIGKDVRKITDDFNKGFNPEQSKREYIGMTATIIYLQETNQLDSVTIDLHRLLQIQDSLSIAN